MTTLPLFDKFEHDEWNRSYIMHGHQTHHLQLEVHQAAGTEFRPSLGVGVVLLKLAMRTREVRTRDHHR